MFEIVVVVFSVAEKRRKQRERGLRVSEREKNKKRKTNLIAQGGRCLSPSLDAAKQLFPLFLFLFFSHLALMDDDQRVPGELRFGCLDERTDGRDLRREREKGLTMMIVFYFDVFFFFFL